MGTGSLPKEDAHGSLSFGALAGKLRPLSQRPPNHCRGQAAESPPTSTRPRHASCRGRVSSGGGGSGDGGTAPPHGARRSGHLFGGRGQRCGRDSNGTAPPRVSAARTSRGGCAQGMARSGSLTAPPPVAAPTTQALMSNSALDTPVKQLKVFGLFDVSVRPCNAFVLT